MLKVCTGLMVTFFTLACSAPATLAGWSIDIESGLAYNGYNDVRIPGNTGSKISLTEELNAESTTFLRLRLIGDIGNRHRLSLLIAPLRIEASGRVDRDIFYNGVNFDAFQTMKSRYRFDSYRITYNYSVHRSPRFRVGIGVTAKVRDASISLENPDRFSEKTNTGFVPLINFSVRWSFRSNLGLIFEGDALAAPQGRAEDVLLAIYSKPMSRLGWRLGYRILEGGADNDEVYNFTLVHYLAVGLTWSL